jgi:hypothetical protein
LCSRGRSSAGTIAGSGGLGSARIAYHTTAQRYTIGSFRINIMKTISTTTLGVYDSSQDPL